MALMPSFVLGQDPPPQGETRRAIGSIEVSVKPLESYNAAKEAMTGRMSINKTFYGDLVGTSKGEMLTGRPTLEGSGGHVAIEGVSTALNGHKGSFTLMHNGTMIRGEVHLTISVVPDSGIESLQDWKAR
jgi:hypothetical protein